MSTLQFIGLALVILIGLCAMLCCVTLWAEPTEQDTEYL